MKRTASIAAATVGALIGLLSTVYVGAAVNLGTSLNRTATVLLLIVCPVIYAMWWAWWLVPLLNALLYGTIAFGIGNLRNRYKST